MSNVFRPIKGFPGYAISESGELISFRNHCCKIMKPQTISHGYLAHSIRKEDGSFIMQYIHSLVAQAFLGDRPEGMVIDHKDGNKLNNHYSNLRYCTQGENIHNPNTFPKYSLNCKHHRKFRKVAAIKDGVVQEFDSVYAACQKLGLKPKKLYKCLGPKSKCHAYDGYTFHYGEM